MVHAYFSCQLSCHVSANRCRFRVAGQWRSYRCNKNKFALVNLYLGTKSEYCCDFKERQVRNQQWGKVDTFLLTQHRIMNKEHLNSIVGKVVCLSMLCCNTLANTIEYDIDKFIEKNENNLRDGGGTGNQVLWGTLQGIVYVQLAQGKTEDRYEAVLGYLKCCQRE